MDIRTELLEALKKEIIGPSSDLNYIDPVTKEEILLDYVHGSPKARYGAGMLYPCQSVSQEIIDNEASAIDSEKVESELKDQKIEGRRESNFSGKEDGEEEPVGMANQYLPSAMGFTVRFKENQEDDKISIQINSAFYERGVNEEVIKTRDRDNKVVDLIRKDGTPIVSKFWIRRPLKIEPINLRLSALFQVEQKSKDFVLQKHSNGENWLKLRIFDRTSKFDKLDQFKTLTFVIINEIQATTNSTSNSSNILFQNSIDLLVDNDNLIVPYRERNSSNDTIEEKEMNLLYRKKRIFAIGHGVSVGWSNDSSNDRPGKINKLFTSVIPDYDLPQVAPASSDKVELSMLELSDLGDWQKGCEKLVTLGLEYGKWIDEIEEQANNSKELESYRDGAKRNVEKCKNSLERIKKGIKLLLESDKDSDLVHSFRWMNRAMLWQQQRSKTKLRKWVRTGKGRNINYLLEDIHDTGSSKFTSLADFHSKSKYNGRWRPFQLAFVLMNLESMILPDSKERKIVDLIWFPTGGGKTEAYLGLTAFNIFYRRLKGQLEWNWEYYGGTTVLMRYTLRLLTTQQYERAASLICGCDLIRKENLGSLGEDESISIGLWVGGTSTPNRKAAARSQFNALKNKDGVEYNFVVMKCPCCGSQIGKVDTPTNKVRIKGLHMEEGSDGKVRFRCENISCEYHGIDLPLEVVDDYIYENPPTLVLGTVDKFAMVPWYEEAGRLFGFRNLNKLKTRIAPPNLIIQDELHLIAGPLGTMVGLYETMIQTLCNDYNSQSPPFISVKQGKIEVPKIIASSATISRAYEQVKSLYGIESREELNIFPAQGLEFGETWFSEEKSLKDHDESGNQKFPGRKYVGILASGYPSAQTAIVRAYASVLQKVKELAKEDNKSIDYYWTLLGYFNSIRELGGASSLVYSDIRERLGQIQNRELVEGINKRYINRIEELTSRISSSQIPSTLKKLEQNYSSSSNKALDICLATNMVATGVDISRLGLMFIHGQPKTTAEYIQASSRVGRELPKGPGIIFTLFSPSKPRDKSQYEQFQGYHERIYSNVEPTSVTPFSVNVRERAIHAILIGLIRHFSTNQLSNSPEIVEDFDVLADITTEIILNRCSVVDSEEEKNTRALLLKRISFWKKGFQKYGDPGNKAINENEGYYPLMYASGSEVKDEIIRENRSLATPTSMRGVDTESDVKIYANNN